MSRLMRAYIRDVRVATKRSIPMEKVKQLPLVSREMLVKWAKDQIELDKGRMGYDNVKDDIRQTSYLDGRVQAFEKIIRVFGPEED
jgi:hypothetical protein